MFDFRADLLIRRRAVFLAMAIFAALTSSRLLGYSGIFHLLIGWKSAELDVKIVSKFVKFQALVF